MYYNKEAQKHETEGRKLFRELINQFNVKEYEFTEDEFNPIDVIFKHKGYKLIADIKVRDRDARIFKTTFLEVQKCKEMKKIKKDNNHDIMWYVNFFGDDLVYIYNIDRHWKNEITPLYTWRTHDYSHGKVMKYFFESPVEKALIYQKIDGLWVQINHDELNEYLRA